MSDSLPRQLKAERASVEAEIRVSFKDVTRIGGVSWSQAEMIDPGGEVDPRAMAEALARDTDRSWEALVDDPNWLHDTAVGGFPFLDAIGTRYYLPPAMIREARMIPGGVASMITVDNDDQRRRVSLLTQPQCAAVARFCRLMVAISRSRTSENEDAGDYFAWVWQAAYDRYWCAFEA